jgi:hypothetical protein
MPLHVTIYYAGLLALGAAALRWGGGPERAVTCVMVVALVGTITLRSELAFRFNTVEYGVLGVDFFATIAFLWIALVADRWWTLWVAALQIIASAGHLAKLVNPHLMQAGYAVMLSASAYPHLILLAAGTLNHSARVRRHNAPLSWGGFCGGAAALSQRLKRIGC